jgi:hypothetical protein
MCSRTLLLTFGLTLVLASGSLGQTVNVGKLRLNGVGLDSTYGQVVKAFGQPVKDSKPTREECAGGREKDVEFTGVSFLFMDAPSKNGKTFEVMGFEVTSAKYLVSGIKVGDGEQRVGQRFGTKFTKGKDDESGAVVWTYEFPDQNSPGFTSVYFRRGKVVKIMSGYTVC